MITKKIKYFCKLHDKEKEINDFYNNLSHLEKRYFIIEILNSYALTRNYLKTSKDKVSFIVIKDILDEMNFSYNEYLEESNDIKLIKLIDFLFHITDNKFSYLEYFEKLNLRISDYKTYLYPAYLKYFKYSNFDYNNKNSKSYYVAHQKYVFSECLSLLEEKSLHKLAIFNDFSLDSIQINIKNDEYEKSYTYLTYSIFEVILKSEKTETEKLFMLDYLFKLYIEKRLFISSYENSLINSCDNVLLKKVLKENYQNESFIQHNTYISGVNPFFSRNNNKKNGLKLFNKISESSN